MGNANARGRAPLGAKLGCLALLIGGTGVGACAHDTTPTTTTAPCPTDMDHTAFTVTEGNKQLDVLVSADDAEHAQEIQARAEDLALVMLRGQPLPQSDSSQEPVAAVRRVEIEAIEDGVLMSFLASDSEGLAGLRSRVEEQIVDWRRARCPIAAGATADSP